jgi:tetratricopeptide (TPR) repeat protein
MCVGQVLFMRKSKIIEALPYYQKAYNLGKDAYSGSGIHYNIALLYSAIGDYEKAIKYMRNALSMNSTSCPYVWGTFQIMLMQEKYDKALVFLDSISRITPCETLCDIARYCLCITQKEFVKAETFLNKAIHSGYIPNGDDRLFVSYLYKETGRETEAYDMLRNYIKELDFSDKGLTAADLGRKSLILLGAAYATLGDNRKALYYLSELEKRVYVFNTPISLETFPGFDSLRNDPEFKAIVKRIENKKDSVRSEIKQLELRGEIAL